MNDDLCCSIHSLVDDGKDGAAGANILTDIQLRLLQQTQELVGAQNFGALLQKPRFTALCEIALALSSSSSWLQLADQTFCFLSVSLAMGGGDKKGEDDQRDLYIQLYLALVHALELAQPHQEMGPRRVRGGNSQNPDIWLNLLQSCIAMYSK